MVTGLATQEIDFLTKAVLQTHPMSVSGILRTCAVLIVFVAVSLPCKASDNPEEFSRDFFTDDIRAGIEAVVRIVSPRMDANVQSYLRTYIERSRRKTELMIGRSAVYFPMFEQELSASGLPEDLKYLAVIESALVPQAISRVGATGLWQFMKPTAKEYGLYMSRYIDERCDPVKSTRAAINYLSYLYKQFESWELAMAAYNAGPGRVRYAIRKSGSKDYWKLQAYLPKETRSYVPGFIAASYVLNYYHDHGLVPEYPNNDIVNTGQMVVYRDVTFTQVQQATGLDMETISFLNPSYIRKFIPNSVTGHLLVLPAHLLPVMEAYLALDGTNEGQEAFDAMLTGVDMEYANRLVEHTYHVKAGDNLYNIARNNNCTVSDLQKWNRISGTTIHIGQRLKIMKMERVLIRATTVVVAEDASASRTMIEMRALPPQPLIPTPLDRIRQSPNAPSGPFEPVIRTGPDLSTPPVQRRRMVSF